MYNKLIIKVRYMCILLSECMLSEENNLGSIYYEGFGIPQNFEKALYWSKLAANNGIVLSQRRLGNLYYKGWGAEKRGKGVKKKGLGAKRRKTGVLKKECQGC